MLRIEKVFIQGFKSFCDPTELVFDEEGVTAVVGPNGCGKCVAGSTLVTLADGRDVSIRELVEAALRDARDVETLDDGTLTRENPHDIRILSLNPVTLRLEARPVSAFIKRETTPHLLRVKTRSGREVTATPYHPLFTLENGRLRSLKAEELKVGVRLALPRHLPASGHATDLPPLEVLKQFADDDGIFVPRAESLQSWANEVRPQFGSWAAWGRAAEVPCNQYSGFFRDQAVSVTTLAKLASVTQIAPPPDGQLKSHGSGQMSLPPRFTPDLARFLGLLIAEGRNTDANQVWFVNADQAVNDEFARLAHDLFGLDTHQYHYKPRAVDSLIYSRTLGVVLERLFNFPINSNSAEKEIPPQLFHADAETQWAFLSGLFEGDAYLCVKPSSNKKGTLAYIEFTSASLKLAQQVIALLLRLGIFARLRSKERYASNTIERRRRTYHSVLIYGTEQVRHTAHHLSFIGEKCQTLMALRELTATANPHLDLIPGVTSLVKEAARQAGVKMKAHRREHSKLAAYFEQRCEASRGGLLEVIGQIERLGTAPEAARGILRQLSVLATSDVYWDEIVSVEQVTPPDPWVYDLSIAETHNFVAGNMIVHNSNVADALSWVIGEQRAKALRGGKMEDVIFQGSRNRQPSGLAEVLLTLRVSETFEIRASENNQEGHEAEEHDHSTLSTEATSSEALAEAGTAPETADAEAQQPAPEKQKKRRKHTAKSNSRVFQEGERIMVGRRLYRTGESEYEMNGRTCRLRDVQDLFAGTGLGGAHYAIIEQGRIGQVLSAKPLDRRALIEEAAGVSKFKLRQRAAELKLEAAKQNLARLADIITEVDRQQNSLKRQAARARRFKRLRQEMRDLMRAVYVADYRATRESISALETNWNEVSERESQTLALIVNRESEQTQAAQLAREAEADLNAARQSSATADLEAERTRQQHAHLTEQLQSLGTRATQFERDRAAINERSDFIEQESTRLRAELQRLEQEINAESAALTLEENDHRSRMDRDAEAEQELEAARRRVYDSATHLERWRQLKRQFTESVERSQTRRQGLATERERATEQAETAEREYASVATQLEESQQQRQENSAHLAEITETLNEQRRESAERQSALLALHRDATAAEHRLKSLVELDERRAYFSEAVQTVMNRGRKIEDGGWRMEEREHPATSHQPPATSFRTLGTLADFVHVAPEHEGMIEAGLRDELQYVLVPSFDDALRAIDFLDTEGRGRATFLVVGLHGAESRRALIASSETRSDDEPSVPGLSNHTENAGHHTQPDVQADAPNNAPTDAQVDTQDAQVDPLTEAPTNTAYAHSTQIEQDSFNPYNTQVEQDSAEQGPAETPPSSHQNIQEAANNSFRYQSLVSLLGLRPEFEEAFKQALPALANAIIVEDAERAVESSLSSRHTEAGAAPIYLARTGERAVGGRIVSGGSRADKSLGVLALKREIAELHERVETLSTAARTAEDELIAINARITHLDEQRAQFDLRLRQVEQQLAVEQQQLQQAERERERLASYLRVVEQETAQVEQERAEFESKLQHASAETEKAESDHREAEQVVTQAQAALADLRRNAEDRSQDLSRRRAEFATKTERRRGLQNDIKRLENEANELHNRLNRSRLEAMEENERAEATQTALASLTEQVQSLTERQQSCATELEQKTIALTEARERLEALELSLRQLREAATQAREERAQLELERTKLTIGLEHIAEACHNELNENIAEVCARLEQAAQTTTSDVELPAPSLIASEPVSELAADDDEEIGEAGDAATAETDLMFWQVPEDFDLTVAKARLDELRAKIDGLGPVNLMALDEIEQVEERWRFLTAQRADIEKAVTDTQAAIAEIKRRSRERFREAFAAINTNFSQMFQELFGGGHGEMRLIDETDILESGIEIIAQPPGKRLQNILLLSGGEKAMAAMALVLAIFRYRPSPFCLLDEVDAPLDEVNIGRFVDKVLEMSRNTQFMIITHSKRTMEAARTLYGVTMEDPGVSKLVSVKLT